MEKRESNTDYGHWEYYKCPFQDCFVCCGTDDAEYYLQSARRQIDPYYVATPLGNMKCYCDRNLYMSMSHSDRKPAGLYLKCPKRYCDFFQWIDTAPRGKTLAHLEGRPREGYPRARMTCSKWICNCFFFRDKDSFHPKHVQLKDGGGTR